MKSFLFCALEHDNTVPKERLKVSNYLLIILLSHVYYKYLQDVLTALCFSSQKPILFSPVLLSNQKPIVYCSLQWKALPYIGKFIGCKYQMQPGRNLRTQQYQPNFTTCCFEHKYITHIIQCGYSCSTVTANLRLRSIYGYVYNYIITLF